MEPDTTQKENTAFNREAVDAILQSIASRQYCDIDLAELLVEIGEPRAATALKPYLLKRQFSWQPGTESNIQRFISKCDKGFQAELDALHATEEAVADARLTAPPAPGTQLREYATAYVFRPAAEARRAFDALETGIRGRNGFPLDAPYQVALVHGPAADFVAVLVRLPTANDESVALHRRVEAWFAQVGVGRPDDYESLSAPLPGRLSRGLRYLASEYTVLAMIDKL